MEVAMEQKLFSDPLTRRTQIVYVLQAALEFLASMFVSDSFLAKLLTSAGVEQASIGIISSVLSFASFIQLVIIVIQRRLKRVRLMVTVCKLLGMVMYTMVYFMPLMNLAPRMNTFLAYFFVVGGALSTYLVLTLNHQWGFAFVGQSIRGRFVAVVEGFSLLTGMVCSLSAGYLVDHCDVGGNLHTAFLLIGIAMALFTVLDLVMLLSMSDPPKDMVRTDPVVSVLRDLLKNRGYRHVIVMQCLMSMATYAIVGFLGTYKNEELGFSVWTVQVFSLIASGIRISLAMPIGRFSDRHSYVNGYILGIALSLAGYLTVVFTAPGTRYLILVFMIFNNLADAGIHSNGDNMLFYFVPFSDYSQALAIVRSLSGLFGFLTSLGAGALFRAVSAHGLVLFDRPVYAQQVQAAVSILLCAAALLYAVTVVRKVPIREEEIRTGAG